MSSICQAFEANAWRKDLCSHCFKSKEEHEGMQLTFDLNTDRADASRRYQSPASLLGTRSYLSSSTLRPLTSVVNNERSSYTKLIRGEENNDTGCTTEKDNNAKNAQETLKNKSIRTNRSVNFHSEEAEIIGYGGDEFFYSDEDDLPPTSEHSTEEDDDDFTEEERKIQTITQKNTSFNSVIRNLNDGSTVKTFVSHGVSLPGEGRSTTAPLVTIRPFVKDSRPSELKINLVSPMRNGQLVAAEKVAKQDNSQPKEEINNNATALKNVCQVGDKWLSNSDPPSYDNKEDNLSHSEDLDHLVQSQPLSDNENDSKAGSKMQGNRITLTRKPPVLKEKPRIPIKPQTNSCRLERILSVEPKSVLMEKQVTLKSLAPMPPVSPVTEPVGMDNQHFHLEVEKPRPEQNKTNVERQTESKQSSSSSIEIRPKCAAESCNAFRSESQINIRFVNITSAINTPTPKKDTVRSVRDHDAASSSSLSASSAREIELVGECKTRAPDLSVKTQKLGVLAQELNAVKRLDGLFTCTSKSEPVDLPLDMNQVDRAASDCTKEDSLRKLQENIDSTLSPKESVVQQELPDGLNRRAFEVLRANLAGSLELTRMNPRYGVNKRQAPSPPLPNNRPCDSESLSVSPANSVSSQTALNELKAEDATLTESQPPPPPPLPKENPSCWAPTKTGSEATCDSALRKVDSFSSCDKTPSGSSFVRSGSISFVPGDSFDQDSCHHQRSISLTRIENESDKPIGTKPLSIREILRNRATQLFQPPDSSTKTDQHYSDLPKSSRWNLQDKKPKNRFSLRKLFGLKKEMKSFSKTKDVVEMPSRTRPEILHPIDFHSGSVEVVTVKPNEVCVDPLRMYANPKPQDQSDSSFTSSLRSSPDISDQCSLAKSNSVGRPRPPPPPRMNSMDQTGKIAETCARPIRPPPPKSAELLQLQKVPVHKIPEKNNDIAQYANLADLRFGVQSKRPERSTSLRVIPSNTYESQPMHSKNETLHYDCVAIKPNGTNCSPDDDGYIIPMRINPRSFSTASTHRHSMSSFNPSNSMKSDAQDDPYATPLARSSRPSIRQSRIDLHCNLEDHYGTVTGANFQALSQLLEQATTKPPIPVHFQELTNGNQCLQWCHFSNGVGAKSDYLQAGRNVFLLGQWRGHQVLLSISECNRNGVPRERIPFILPKSLTSFQDNVPNRFFDISGQTAETLRGHIEVYPPGEMVTLMQSSGLFAAESEGDEALQRNLCVLLQLTRAFLWLQEKGLSNINTESIVFYREYGDDFHRLLWVEAEKDTLYEAVHFAKSFDVGQRTTPSEILADLMTTWLPSSALNTIKSSVRHDLGRMKTCFEYLLFGPSSNVINKEDSCNVGIFQRWLDVERASILNELIRTQGLYRIKLSIFQELHLTFLVSTTAECLYEASQTFPAN